MAPRWKKIYDLAEDHKTVANVQRATLLTDDYGILPEVALFGSEDWWRAIDSGLIPRCELVGTISRVYMSGHNDYPEFEIDCEGTKTIWTREGDDEAFKVGRKVRLEYVAQKAKKRWKVTGLYHNKVLSVYVEED